MMSDFTEAWARSFKEPQPYHRLHCEYQYSLSGGFWSFCQKRGRWLFNGYVRCGEHKTSLTKGIPQ